jgi:hypothetical protein
MLQASSDTLTPLGWVTLGIALAGLVLGVVNATVQVLAWRLNRAWLKVELSTAIIPAVGHPPGLDPNEGYVMVTIHNAGQRPTTVGSARFDLERGGWNVPIIHNPPGMVVPTSWRVEEGEELPLFVAVRSLRDAVSRGGPLRSVTIKTQGGQTIRRRLPSHIRQLLEPSPPGT